MNTELISKALCFHGQPLQKIWAGERGDHDLYQLGITNPDFSLYLERQKNLTFQDRAKRLKLHQFLARKATELFDRGLQSSGSNSITENSTGVRQDTSETVVAMPPYEYFLNSATQDKSGVLHCTLEAVKPGNIIYGVVTKPYSSGTHIKVLCTGEPLVRYLADINIRALLPSKYMIPGIHDKKGNPKSYAINDFVCCEVLDISIDAERMTLGMKGVLTKDTTAPLGLISAEQIPNYYRRIQSDCDENFQDYLTVSKTFNNSNCYEMLYQAVGLDINDTYSHMRSLKHRFPSQDYAIELRQTQASKWAFRSVADGIEHFKIGRHVEAFQCLNKALAIDPRNVEGLVARGALYANKGSFIKAVEDFETALKLNAFHTNARKYMGETLVALGRSYEEENQIDEAVKAYQNCLNIIPNHEQARISLDALKRRPGHVNPVIEFNLLSIPGTTELKKKKKSKHRSSSSSSSSADSSQSSTDSSSSGDSSASDSEAERQKKKLRKQKSLSPLSKRMGDMNAGNVGSGFEFSQPFHMIQKEQQADYNKMDDFLVAGDDDYETRVKKLLEDASKHRKERDGKSSVSKKKSKKKRKKAKKEAARLEKKSKQMADANSFENAFKSPDDANLHASLEKYERSLKELKTYQQKLTIREDLFVDNEEPPPAPSFSIRHTTLTSPRKQKRESPPPKAPPMTIRSQPITRPPVGIAPTKSIRPPPPIISGPSGRSTLQPFVSNSTASIFKPFPIKGPVVLDKFGCFRLVAPPPEEVAALTRRTRSRSRSKSPSHSRSHVRSRRTRSRSVGRRRRRSKSRTRRRSPMRGRRSRSRGARRSRSRGRRSRSLTHRRTPNRRSRSLTHRRTLNRRSRSLTHRRTPSPFNPNRRPRSRSPGHRRHSRSPIKDDRKAGIFNRSKKTFGNRVWQRPVDRNKDDNGSKSPSSHRDIGNNKNSKSTVSAASDASIGAHSSSSVDGRWKHDKFVKEDGISLEEIDKIITQAKKERKEEILQRDKKILKKNSTNSF